MPKAVSATEAKNRLGSLLAYVAEQGDDVVVESQGKPKAVLISFAAYQEVLALREQKRRADALDELRRLQKEVSARNQDLTEEEAEAIAEELSQAAIARLVARGELAFERDRS